MEGRKETLGAMKAGEIGIFDLSTVHCSGASAIS